MEAEFLKDHMKVNLFFTLHRSDLTSYLGSKQNSR